MSLFGRTLAVGEKLLKDLAKILFLINVVVQSIFLITYGLSIYSNINDFVFLILYIILENLAIIGFIYFLIANKKKKKSKIFERTIRIFRYIVNGSLLTVNIIEMVKYGTSDFNKVLLIVSGVSLVAQIIFELIKIFVDKYIELFMYSIQRDIQPFSILGRLNQVKGNLFEVIDAPLEAIAGRIDETPEEIDEIKIKVEKLYKEYDEKRKCEVKQRSNENAQKQKKEIVEHLSIIKGKLFRKTKKVE